MRVALRDRLSRVCLGRVTAGDSEISAKMDWEWFCCSSPAVPNRVGAEPGWARGLEWPVPQTLMRLRK